SGGRKRRTAGTRPSASAAPEVVDAELERDHRVRATHQRRLLANFEERGRLPVGEALADEQGEADGHLREPAPHAEDARDGAEREEPAPAPEQFEGGGGRPGIAGRPGIYPERLPGDGGNQRNVEGSGEDVG